APFSALVPKGASLVAYQENYGTIANNILAASPRHPVITRALALATEAVNRGDRDGIWLSTGPGLITRALGQLLAQRKWDGWRRSAIVYELWEIQRMVEINCPLPYKQTRRHWSRSEQPVQAQGNDAAGLAAA